MQDVDVAVIGAGPAGSASALLLAKRGFRVLLVDKARFPRDKVCGEALSPAAIPILDRLGGRDRLGGFALRGARLVSPSGQACEGRYPSIDGFPDYGLSLPRLAFDAHLVDMARKALGIHMIEGCKVERLRWEGGRCTGVITSEGPVDAKAVVLAEGRFSTLHPGIRRHIRPETRKRRAFVATLDGVEGLDDLLELRLPRADLQIVLSPQGGNRAAVCAVLTGGSTAPLGSRPLDGFLDLLRCDHTLAKRLGRAKAASALKGMTLDPYRSDPAPADGLVAVGDTTGFFDPLTGEGMYRALRSAELASSVLAEGLDTGDLSLRRLIAYSQTLEREFRWTYRFVECVVAMSRWPRASELAIGALTRDPSLASRMIAYQGALLPAHRFFPDMLKLAIAAIR